MQQLLYQSVRSVLQHARRSCFRAAFGHSSCSLRMRGATPESTWPQRSRASLRSPSRRSKEETMQAANRKGPPRCQTHPHKPRLQMLARSFRSSHCSMASREQMLRRKPQVLSLRLQSLIRTERPLRRRTALSGSSCCWAAIIQKPASTQRAHSYACRSTAPIAISSSRSSWTCCRKQARKRRSSRPLLFPTLRASRRIIERQSSMPTASVLFWTCSMQRQSRRKRTLSAP